MKKILLISACLLSVYSFSQVTELTNDKQKLSYAIGLDLGNSFKGIGLENDIDFAALKQAIEDKFNSKDEKDLLFSQDSAQTFVMAYMDKKRQNYAKENTVKADKFLEKNKKKKGIKVTASGLQYEVLSKGKGKEMPKSTDLVTVNYEGKKLNGEVFDSNEKNNEGKPIEFPLQGVIKGWTEGIQLMSKGAKYRFYIPPALAYGENGGGPISANELLIFDVELIDFKNQNIQTEEAN